MDAPVLARGRDFTQYHLGGDRREVRAAPALNFQDAQGAWQETRALWEASPHPAADFQMVQASYRAYALQDFSRDRLLRFSAGSYALDLTPLPVSFANQYFQRALALPVRGVPAVAEGSHLSWPGAYGPGTRFEWDVSGFKVDKKLYLDGPWVFPQAANNITKLIVPFRLDLGLGLGQDRVERVAAGLGAEDCDWLDFSDDRGEFLFMFTQPFMTDAAGTVYPGRLRLFRTTQGVVAALVFSWPEVRDATYPLVLDPSITQVSEDSTLERSMRPDGTVLTSLYVGTFTGAFTGIDYQTVQGWADVPLPQRAVIDAAELHITSMGGARSQTLTAETLFYDQGDPSFPVDAPDHYARPLTSASAPWLPSRNTGDRNVTPPLREQLQQVVDRDDWQPGNMLVSVIRDVLRNNTANNRMQLANIGYGQSTRAELVVSYQDPVAGIPAPTLILSAGDARVSASWPDLSADGATGYQLRRDGVVVYDGSGTGFVDTDLTNGVRYSYTLAVRSASGVGEPGAARTIVPQTGELRTDVYTFEQGFYTYDQTSGFNQTSELVIGVIGENTGYRAGVRFSGLELNPEDDVREVYIDFTAASPLSGVFSTDLSFQRHASAPALTGKTDFDSRERTAPVSWTPPSPWDTGVVYRTPNLKAAFDELRAVAGFGPGSDVVAFWGATPGITFPSSYSNLQAEAAREPTKGPRLVVVRRTKLPPQVSLAGSGR